MDTSERRNLIMDNILVELGELGRFQILQYFLFSIIVLITCSVSFAFVFTTGQMDYRCKIPNCDLSMDDSIEFETNWLQYAVPFKADGRPASCQRYQHTDGKDLSCDEHSFNQSVIEDCDEFVFAQGEVTIVSEFNITCEENEWQLALIGSLGFAADIAAQPICAYLSDKYGRRTILIATLLLGGVCGLIKSFSVNYAMFATMEFLTEFVSCGSYMTIYIMAIELAGPTKRVFSGTLISFMFSFSQALSGLVAMMIPNFRTFLQALHVPNILMITFVWMVPESVRWLVVTGKIERAKSIITKAAKMNKIILSEGVLDNLSQTFNLVCKTNPKSEITVKKSETFLTVLQSRILALRLAMNIVVWFMIKLIYYGMTIQSVALDGNKYVNFILGSVVDLPAILLSSLLMEWIGRKWSLCLSLLLTGVACVGTDFIPEDAWLSVLIVYLIGKCCATIAFSILYVYTTEQFPTSLRHSTMNACSTFGTFGSILAPFTMLLISTWRSLPLLIFGASALLSGLLVLFLPETKNTRLPDTIAEAEHLTTFSKVPIKGTHE